ncbi:MAG: methyltransferase domain-containing protein [bacterium]
MKDKHDAFGHGLYDYLNGIRGAEIIERDDGMVEPDGGPKVYFAEYRDWSPVEKKAIRYAQGRVLDIGCGAGRCLLYLKNKGFDVTGIDTSPLALKVCRKRGVKKVKLLSVTQVTPKLGIFDTLLMYGNNFGLMANPHRARWLFRRFVKITSARGRIIAAALSPYPTTTPEHLEYQKRNRKRGRPAGQIRLRVRYKRYVTPWLDWLLVSQKEMTDILRGTGWQPVKFIDGPQGRYAAIIEKTG